MSTLIQADKLYRYYADYCAVKDVSFSLKKGEILGFLGPNGAGKTTTMQMLSGNLAPSHGEISINDINLSKHPEAAKMFIGYLPDSPPLYVDCTVMEYLHYCAQLHRISKAEISNAITKVVQRCHLTSVTHRLIANLSKGFMQRVGIAQAIIHNPALIILDEPTTGLDPIQIREIRSLISELSADHGIILSTHALSEIQQSCTHVQIIKQGKLIFKDTLEGLEQAMNTATLFIATRLAVDEELIKRIPAVINMTALHNNRYHIQHQLKCNPAEQIAEIITNAGWGLLEMTPKIKSLEEVFIDLNDNEG